MISRKKHFEQPFSALRSKTHFGQPFYMISTYNDQLYKRMINCTIDTTIWNILFLWAEKCGFTRQDSIFNSQITPKKLNHMCQNVFDNYTLFKRYRGKRDTFGMSSFIRIKYLQSLQWYCIDTSQFAKNVYSCYFNQTGFIPGYTHWNMRT